MPRGLRIALLLAPGLVVVAVLFLGGLVMAVAQSFGYQPFLDQSVLSADAYRAMTADPAVRASTVLTLRLALVSTGVAAVLGVVVALAVYRLERGRRLASAVLQSTLPVPHLVGALTMLLLLQPSGFVSRLAHAVGLSDSTATFPMLVHDRWGWSIIAEYAWKEVPFVGIVVLAALSSGVRELEDAARTLGANPWYRFRLVVLPLILPGVLATSIIVFAFTFGSYEVPNLLGRQFPAVLPVVAYDFYADTDLGARPQAMAISVCIALFVGALVAAYLALAERVVRRS